MIMSFNITSGPTATAQKVVLYGVEGIGKTTFASQFPDPLFIDTEGSTANMDVKRLPKPTSWQMLLNEVEHVKQTQICETLVIDTADWAERLAMVDVQNVKNVPIWTDVPWGKGYDELADRIGKLLNLLSDLVELGINVVITAHGKLVKATKPDDMGSYEFYSLKLEQKSAPLLKEWSDLLLFANYETTLITDEKTKKQKATGGQRVMFTSHHPAWDAKNRHGLPDKIPFEFAAVAHIFQKAAPVQQPMTEQVPPTQAAPTVETPQENQFSRDPITIDPAIPQELAQLMMANEVTEEEIRTLVAEKGFKPLEMPIRDYPSDLIQGGLVAQWDKIFTEIKSKRVY